MPKYSRKFVRFMIYLCILIGLAAFAIAVMAIALKEYTTAVTMLAVAGCQVANYITWKKNI